MLTVGLGGVKRDACVALTAAGRVIGVCKQERINRVRDSGFPADGLPDDAIQALLERNDLRREAVDRYVIAEPWPGTTVDRVDHDRAHAATAYLSSPFAAATVVVCDEDAALSVWAGEAGSLTQDELFQRLALDQRPGQVVHAARRAHVDEGHHGLALDLLE